MKDPTFLNPKEYVENIHKATTFLRKHFPKDFVPRVALTLGSGGLGSIAEEIQPVFSPIPYETIPGFLKPTAVGHSGLLHAGYLSGVPLLGFQGRTHYYELGDEPSQVSALKRVVFPVYVVRSLGASVYMATNAAGGLNPQYGLGDLMAITSHIGLFFPNVLAGPQIPFMDPMRFQPQNEEYTEHLRTLLLHAAKDLHEETHVHEGVYCALTGPTYETRSECQMLRTIGADAVGMSTVPEIITATNIGMETVGISLITNVIAQDGTNATSHEEVMATLNNAQTKQRFTTLIKEFFTQYASVMNKPSSHL